MSRLSSCAYTRLLHEEDYCFFCGNNTHGVGGLWVGDSKEMVVCIHCKDKLIHLFFDTCLDDKDFIEKAQEVKLCNGFEFAKDDTFEILEHIELTSYIHKIASRKSEREKRDRYEIYQKLKKEFEGTDIK